MKGNELMGAIDEGRKVIQDFLAPELRTIAEKLEAVKSSQAQMREDMSARFSAMREDTAANFGSMREDAAVNFGSMREDMKTMEARLLRAIEQSMTEVLLTIKLAEMTNRAAQLEKQVDALQHKSIEQ